MSAVVLAVVVGSFLGVLASLRELEDSNRELSLAYMEMERAVEEIRTQNFDEVFAMYNADTSDDPGGMPEVPGSTFTLQGTLGHEAEGSAQGTIRFPVDGKDGTYLREDLDAPEFGLPRDLNGDGVIDGQNHNEDFVILPMIVRIEWTGGTSNRSVEFPIYLYDH